MCCMVAARCAVLCCAMLGCAVLVCAVRLRAPLPFDCGAQEIDAGSGLVAIHDSARPLVTVTDTLQCLEDALEVGWQL